MSTRGVAGARCSVPSSRAAPQAQGLHLSFPSFRAPSQHPAHGKRRTPAGTSEAASSSASGCPPVLGKRRSLLSRPLEKASFPPPRVPREREPSSAPTSSLPRGRRASIPEPSSFTLGDARPLCPNFAVSSQSPSPQKVSSAFSPFPASPRTRPRPSPPCRAGNSGNAQSKGARPRPPPPQLGLGTPPVPTPTPTPGSTSRSLPARAPARAHVPPTYRSACALDAAPPRGQEPPPGAA
ncbi:hypothetical protein H8959_002337 [Pygathrix nigripes]